MIPAASVKFSQLGYFTLGDPMALKWTDTLDIAIALDETHPDADPRRAARGYSSRSSSQAI